MELARACTPYTQLRRGLLDCRVALVTTAGAYAAGMQPFTENDLSFRKIPDHEETRLIHFIPGHYDTSKAALDPNILFPLDRIHDLVAAGAGRGTGRDTHSTRLSTAPTNRQS